MDRRSFYLSVIALSVSACSGTSSRHASGDFNYATQQEATPITVPANLDTPQPRNEYHIPTENEVTGPIGKSVDVRAPSLALPIAASTRVVAERDDAIIWFDKVLEDRDLTAFIGDAVKDNLAENNVAIAMESADGTILESDWFHNEKESGWLFTEVESAESMRFKYLLDTKPHGRSTSLKVELIDYMKTDASGGSRVMNPIDKHRAEMAMLNQVTGMVDYKYRLQNRELQIMYANQSLVSIGKNPEEEPAYVVDMEKDLLWSNLPVFFERQGFEIDDLNEDQKLYFVTYKKPSVGFWDSIWGDEVEVLELEEKPYQFKLTPIGNKSVLTIYQDNGEVLPEETLDRVFDVMEKALSFRDL